MRLIFRIMTNLSINSINNELQGASAYLRRRLQDSPKLLHTFAFASLLMACSCTSSVIGGDDSVSAETDAPESADGDTLASEGEPAYHADNDIAMAVRSLVYTINDGEPLDSTEYNFEGVLTDGQGAPLFTDFEGLPGQWEVDVKNSREVHIRNIGTGDLMPGELMEYLRTTFNTSSVGPDDELRLTDSYEEGDTSVELYSFGRASLRVETRPEVLPTGEVGPKLVITLRYDTVPAVES